MGSNERFDRGGTPNIQKLCDYINQQPDPQLFMQYLLTLAAQIPPPSGHNPPARCNGSG